jgi:hypothetical protein
MVSGQLHAVAALSIERTLDTHWIGGWVSLTSIFDAVDKKNPLPHLINHLMA